MSNECLGDHDFYFNGSAADLEKFFPKLDVQPSRGALQDSSRKRGVHAMHIGGNRMYGYMKGPCTNLENGRCRLRDSCFSNINQDAPTADSTQNG